MTKAEARNVYRTSYLYWHGKGRCWDAAPRTSHRLKKVAAARANRVEASHKTKTRPKPEVKVEVVDPSPVPTGANGTLTPDDLRKWANSMAAMPSEPIVKILDRWPDEELPQHRTKPAAIAEPSLMKDQDYHHGDHHVDGAVSGADWSDCSPKIIPQNGALAERWYPGDHRDRRLTRQPWRWRRRLFKHVNSFTATCALSVHNAAAEGHAMTQPAKRIPTWLTIDVLVIVISLAIIGIGIGIGIAP